MNESDFIDAAGGLADAELDFLACSYPGGFADFARHDPAGAELFLVRAAIADPELFERAIDRVRQINANSVASKALLDEQRARVAGSYPPPKGRVPSSEGGRASLPRSLPEKATMPDPKALVKILAPLRLADRIVTLRSILHVSQEEFATLVRVKRNAVSNWEADENSPRQSQPSRTVRARMSQMLGVPASLFVQD